MNGRPITRDELFNVLLKKHSSKKNIFKHRNSLQLALMCLGGIREIEIAKINQSVIYKDGLINEIIVIPKDVSYNKKERPVPIVHKQLKKIIEDYYEWLIVNNLNVDGNTLFFDDKFNSYTLQNRGGKNLVPKTLNDHIDTMIKNCGLLNSGVSRKSFIRTYTIEAYRAGMGLKDLIVVTGQSQETIKKTLAMDLTQYESIAKFFKNKLK